ncbi:hypothetical protein Dfulv_14900 [Dactylosporangium fulvum]|uniref:Uncharacterized protein n=1 Tax=Dactylosporangium fulvum TaxID=53359 RepID=A0ABY5W638_9ACTN|nr:hypothetical protein [Dactylosporangium fulvum]UWP85450.1 hypothetical protein Dfulv_14900 [Dactylosporangium fulvum]
MAMRRATFAGDRPHDSAKLSRLLELAREVLATVVAVLGAAYGRHSTIAQASPGVVDISEVQFDARRMPAPGRYLADDPLPLTVGAERSTVLLVLRASSTVGIAAQAAAFVGVLQA